MNGWSAAIGAVALAACRFNFDALGDAGADAARDGGDPPVNHAFVTSTLQAPASLGGLAGADAVCMARARAASLSGNFVAYLSTSTVNAVDRLAGARGWYRIDGKPFVDLPSDVGDGHELYPLRVDEMGVDLGLDPERVVTGTYGGRVNSSCSDYTDGVDMANVGIAYDVGGGFENVNYVACAVPTRLYCFQTDHATPLAFERSVGRHAFISKAEFIPNSGVGAADTICGDEAAATGLTGSYLAVLPTTLPASARFDTSGPNWVRPDGIALAPSAAQFLGGEALAALNVALDGTFVDALTVTGGVLPDATTGTQNCANWTDANAGNGFGYSSGTVDDAFAQTTGDCMTSGPVYCLEK